MMLRMENTTNLDIYGNIANAYYENKEKNNKKTGPDYD